MGTISNIKADITSLNEYQLRELFNYIGEMLTLGSSNGSFNKEFREARFSKGQCCPHCESTSVVKNGKLKGKQRYICRSCSKSFNDLTKSALSCTKLPLQTWIEYFKGMILGLSIRKNAENAGVGVKTSFYMRHKVLDCIKAFIGIGDVDGIVEIDETFIAEFFKGNHNKSGFEMPRPARKRGKKVKKRGISNEQVCIATAIDRNDIYYINHVNSLHSNFKIWMYRFKGVSTKFLPNYMSWYKWLQSFNNDKEVIKTKNMLIHSIIPFFDTKIKGYKGREIVFI